MKLRELIEKCSFHDSSVEEVEYDQDSRSAKIVVRFCNGFQEDFTGRPEDVIMVHLLFRNVSAVDFGEFTPGCRRSDEIFNEEIVENEAGEEGLLFFMEKEWTDTYYEIRIFAEEVDFVAIGPA